MADSFQKLFDDVLDLSNCNIWISFSEQLPKIGEKVLVTGINDEGIRSYYEVEFQEDSNYTYVLIYKYPGGKTIYNYKNMTHWMRPLIK